MTKTESWPSMNAWKSLVVSSLTWSAPGTSDQKPGDSGAGVGGDTGGAVVLASLCSRMKLTKSATWVRETRVTNIVATLWRLYTQKKKPNSSQSCRQGRSAQNVFPRHSSKSFSFLVRWWARLGLLASSHKLLKRECRPSISGVRRSTFAFKRLVRTAVVQKKSAQFASTL